MKIGCCVNMLSAMPDKIGREFLPLLPALGYDYVELPLAQIMDLDEGGFRRLLGERKDAGIPCESCNNFFPASVRLTGSEANFQQISDYLSRALDRAAALGVAVIVFGSVGAKNVPEGFPHHEARKQIVEALHLISEKAAPYPFQIAIEPVNRRESNIVLNLREGLRLKAQVPEDNIKCLVDYYHMALEREDPGAILEAGGLLLHTHFACPVGRAFPSETDGQIYTPFFEALGRIQYSGRLSIEALSTQFTEDSKHAIPYLRALARDLP